ncbi:MAG: ankyrin repeat domain-containing protein [Desulfotomaculum sp.]|nr:ankyrin repeat domain-containing protein [Desulfotomaculum sp.]
MRINGFIKVFLLAALSLVILTACGEKPEDARHELEKKNIEYSEKAFLEQAHSGKTENVKLFVQAGMKTDVKDHNGNTALMLAALEGHKDTVKLLLEKGADVNEKNNLGKTALFYAATEGHKEIVELLIDKGADINIKAENGRTALDYAKQRGHQEIVDLLEKAKENKN